MGRVRARPLLVYDPAWPDLFEAEAAAIRGALAPAVVAVEHVGSTSIEGMTAKPVIDILLGLHRASYPIANGVRFARSATSGEHVDRQSGSTSKGTPRSHYVHVVRWGGAQWHQYLRFRDYMRDHPRRRLRPTTSSSVTPLASLRGPTRG